MRRGLLLLSTLLVALAVVPAATANRPFREVNEAQEDVVITGQCAFPVLGHVEGREIITTFTDRAGNPVKQIGVFPGNTLTFTNLDTDASITLVATGSFHVQAQSDGSITVTITGHGPFLSNPITGEPGIWYLSGGQVLATFDAEGNMTSVALRGNLVDVCAQLAS